MVCSLPPLAHTLLSGYLSLAHTLVESYLRSAPPAPVLLTSPVCTSVERENMLHEGVEAQGEGKWKEIQEGSVVLKNRTTVCVCVLRVIGMK